MANASLKKQHGLERNVSLFDSLRRYAYKQIKTYKGVGVANFVYWQSHLIPDLVSCRLLEGQKREESLTMAEKIAIRASNTQEDTD